MIMAKQRWYLVAAALLLTGAAFLRLGQIDRRPFHADEAVQAYQTWQLLRGNGYAYDPADKHGPFLYYAAAGIARISGWSPAVLDEARLRLITLLAGLGTLALLAGSTARLGRGPAFIATALLAAAPVAVIYDTYFVQEAWFSFFTWALFFVGLRLLDQPTVAPALLAGLLAGLMQATKETSVLHFVALGAALIAIKPLKDLARLWPRLLVALLAALLVYVVFYSAGFTRWSGVIDGVRTYFSYANRAAGSARDQPWYYYLQLLWPHTTEGVRWGEPFLLVLALAGAVFAFSSRANRNHRAVAVFTVTVLLIYSLIPYKTPWLLLTPYVGLTLLAGFGVVAATQQLPAALSRVIPTLLCLGLLADCVQRDASALDRYANDTRNPYVYQPTSPQFPQLLARLHKLTVQAGRPLRVAVVSPDSAWPLPWYLRNEPTIGFFVSPPSNIADYDIALYDSRLAHLPATDGAPVFGLRPNVLLWLISSGPTP
jgi:uncharacterized protein (TIGR03663 family)